MAATGPSPDAWPLLFDLGHAGFDDAETSTVPYIVRNLRYDVLAHVQTLEIDQVANHGRKYLQLVVIQIQYPESGALKEPLLIGEQKPKGT